jgi:hypothetical protein
MHTDTLGVRGSSGNTPHMLLAGKEAVPSQALLTSPVASEQAEALTFGGAFRLRNRPFINRRTLRFS